ncbi:hypothetical protein FXO38_24455 [Capsicum annuum]|nr:hypothetical protein FXO38_24455 [Capsicum annuum]
MNVLVYLRDWIRAERRNKGIEPEPSDELKLEEIMSSRENLAESSPTHGFTPVDFDYPMQNHHPNFKFMGWREEDDSDGDEEMDDMENEDRTWMYNRIYPNRVELREEYKAGIAEFIAKAMILNDFLIEGIIRCPCMKDQCPRNPKVLIDVYLYPLIDELNLLWHEGVETYDVSMKQNFRLRATLMWTINDFPAYGMMSGWSTAAKRNTSDFMKNKTDFEEPPPILSREEIWDRVRNLDPSAPPFSIFNEPGKGSSKVDPLRYLNEVNRTMFPENGGYVVWVSSTLGPYWGFQQGWVKWINGVIDNALYPVMFLDYLKSAIPALGGGLPRIVAVLALTLVLTYMNYRGLTIVAWMAVSLVDTTVDTTAQVEEFQKSIEKWHQTQPSLEDGTMVQPSPADMANMWITVVGGPKKGRTYRIGVLQSSSSPSLFLSPSSILQTVGEMKVMKMQIVELTQKYAANDAKFAKFEELVKKHMP